MGLGDWVGRERNSSKETGPLLRRGAKQTKLWLFTALHAAKLKKKRGRLLVKAFMFFFPAPTLLLFYYHKNKKYDDQMEFIHKKGDSWQDTSTFGNSLLWKKVQMLYKLPQTNLGRVRKYSRDGTLFPPLRVVSHFPLGPGRAARLPNPATRISKWPRMIQPLSQNDCFSLTRWPQESQIVFSGVTK